VGLHQLRTAGTPCPPTPRRREGAGESGAHCPVQRPLQSPPQHPHQRVRNHSPVHLPPHATVQQLQPLRVTMLRACVVTMLLTWPTAAPAPRIVEDVHPVPGRQLKDSMLTYGCSAHAFACVGVVRVCERCPVDCRSVASVMSASCPSSPVPCALCPVSCVLCPVPCALCRVWQLLGPHHRLPASSHATAYAEHGPPHHPLQPLLRTYPGGCGCWGHFCASLYSHSCVVFHCP
jgi:hypothetical protein